MSSSRQQLPMHGEGVGLSMSVMDFTAGFALNHGRTDISRLCIT